MSKKSTIEYFDSKPLNIHLYHDITLGPTLCLRIREHTTKILLNEDEAKAIEQEWSNQRKRKHL